MFKNHGNVFDENRTTFITFRNTPTETKRSDYNINFNLLSQPIYNMKRLYFRRGNRFAFVTRAIPGHTQIRLQYNTYNLITI